MTFSSDYQISPEYTGHVDQNSFAIKKIVQNWLGPVMSIIKFSVAPLDNNVYIVTCLTTDTSIIIDCANHPERILGFVQAAGVEIQEIITTHSHSDHWQALYSVAMALDAPTAAGIDDASDIDVPIDRLIEDGDTFLIGNLVCEPLKLRGHTRGSIALSITVDGQTHIFTGDALFPGGVGKTQSRKDFQLLMADVEMKIFDRYLDSTIIYPGHGDDTIIERERPQLAMWRARGW